MSVFGWYIWQTSCSTPLLVPSSGCSPQPRLARACKIGVLALSNSSQKVAFPFPEKFPVTSALVNAWNAGSAAVLVGPRASAIDFRLITLRLLPVPVTMQEFEHKSGYRRRAKTRTSVSGEYIESWVAPWAEASRACKIIFVSASSCVLRKCLTSLCVASHSVPYAKTTCLPLALSFTFFVRNVVSSPLVFEWATSFFIGTLAMWVESVMR